MAEVMERMTCRLNKLPLILLVKVPDSETACRAYWAGNRLGTVGKLKVRNVWGWKMEGTDECGMDCTDQGAALAALWDAWEVKHGEHCSGVVLE